MNLKKIIIPYSLIKIKANSPPAYSILNPDTISDSPSAKSNGVRLLSAMHKSIQINNTGKKLNPNHKFICNNLKVEVLNELAKKAITRINNTKHTS